MERLSKIGGIRNWIRGDQFVNQLEEDSLLVAAKQNPAKNDPSAFREIWVDIRSNAELIDPLRNRVLEKGTNVGSEVERTVHAVVQLLDISDERSDFSERLEYDNRVCTESSSEFFKRVTPKCSDSEKTFQLEARKLSKLCSEIRRIYPFDGLSLFVRQ